MKTLRECRVMDYLEHEPDGTIHFYIRSEEIFLIRSKRSNFEAQLFPKYIPVFSNFVSEFQKMRLLLRMKITYFRIELQKVTSSALPFLFIK